MVRPPILCYIFLAVSVLAVAHGKDTTKHGFKVTVANAAPISEKAAIYSDGFQIPQAAELSPSEADPSAQGCPSIDEEVCLDVPLTDAGPSGREHTAFRIGSPLTGGVAVDGAFEAPGADEGERVRHGPLQRRDEGPTFNSRAPSYVWPAAEGRHARHGVDTPRNHATAGHGLNIPRRDQGPTTNGRAGRLVRTAAPYCVAQSDDGYGHARTALPSGAGPSDNGRAGGSTSHASVEAQLMAGNSVIIVPDDTITDDHMRADRYEEDMAALAPRTMFLGSLLPVHVQAAAAPPAVMHERDPHNSWGVTALQGSDERPTFNSRARILEGDGPEGHARAGSAAQIARGGDGADAPRGDARPPAEGHARAGARHIPRNHARRHPANVPRRDDGPTTRGHAEPSTEGRTRTTAGHGLNVPRRDEGPATDGRTGGHVRSTAATYVMQSDDGMHAYGHARAALTEGVSVPPSGAGASTTQSQASVEAQLMNGNSVIIVPDDTIIPDHLRADRYEEDMAALAPRTMFLGSLMPVHAQEAPPAVMHETDPHNSWGVAAQQLREACVAATAAAALWVCTCGGTSRPCDLHRRGDKQ